LRDEERAASDFYDRFRNRLMFPISNDVGEVIAFSGRVLNGDPGAAKYINSPETPLFRKGHVLFGLHKSKRALIEANSAIVCEGQLDLIALFETGIQNVVAPQGTAFTENQARVLKRFVDEVVLCFDSDVAGQKATERSLAALLQNDLLVRVAEVPSGEDPDSLVRKSGRQKLEDLITSAPDFFDYWIAKKTAPADLKSMGAKMQVARDLGATVAHVHEPIMRGEVIHKIAARLAIRAADFEKLVNESRSITVGARDSAGDISAPARLPSHEVAMLCLLALRDEEARAFLHEQNWQEALSNIPDTDLLAKILDANLRPTDAASLNLFQTTLTPAEESVVSGWMLQRLPANPAELAREWWNGLQRVILRRQLEAAESRLRSPNLSTGEIVQLQKQVLDLRGQLHELRPFSSVRAREP
jgi:DNA primase